jgi:hypothetical protein
MKPHQCVHVLTALAAEPDMGQYVKDALLQAAAYLTELEQLVGMLDKCTAEMERAGRTAEAAAAEIQRLNLEIAYLQSGK